MTKNHPPILPLEYIKGHDFTEKLKKVLNCNNHQELAEILNIPKSTFSTWNLHNRTSFELIVRLHLAIGVPVRELALGISEERSINEAPASNTIPQKIPEDSQLSTRILSSYCLSDGKLLETGHIPYSVRTLKRFKIENSDLIEVSTNSFISIVDKSSTDPVAGNYLISINGRYSINHILRLPDSLSVTFDGNITKEISDNDIDVIGKVVVETKNN